MGAGASAHDGATEPPSDLGGGQGGGGSDKDSQGPCQGPCQDPWAALGDDEALAALRAEEGETLAAAEGGGPLLPGPASPVGAIRVVAEGCSLDSAKLGAVVGALLGANGGGGGSGCSDGGGGSGGDGGGGSAGLASRVTFLDVSSNRLADLACLAGAAALRGLNASGNPLAGPPGLRGCARLVSLDLSFCPGLDLSGGSGGALAHLGPTLLSLALTGCGLASPLFG